MKREKKLARVATSPSTRSISSPGVWLFRNFGSSRRQCSVRSARSALVAVRPTFSATYVSAMNAAWVARATARKMNPIMTSRSMATDCMAESMKTRRICGLASSRPMAASTRHASTRVRAHCGRKYVARIGHTDGVARTPRDCISGERGSCRRRFSVGAGWADSGGGGALLAADGLQQAHGVGAAVNAQWLALIRVEAGHDRRAVDGESGELARVEEIRVVFDVA